MKEQLTITEIMQIREVANTELENLFNEMDWKRKYKLTDGDVRAVIEAYQKTIADKKEV